MPGPATPLQTRRLQKRQTFHEVLYKELLGVDPSEPWSSCTQGATSDLCQLPSKLVDPHSARGATKPIAAAATPRRRDAEAPIPSLAAVYASQLESVEQAGVGTKAATRQELPSLGCALRRPCGFISGRPAGGEHKLAQRCAVEAQKSAASASLRAMQIRALAGSCTPSTPRSQQSRSPSNLQPTLSVSPSPVTCYPAASLPLPSSNSVSTPRSQQSRSPSSLQPSLSVSPSPVMCHPAASLPPSSSNSEFGLVFMPQHLLLRMVPWLLPVELARMTMTGLGFWRNSEDLAMWALKEVCGLDIHELRQLRRRGRGIAEVLPALRAFFFAACRVSAHQQARCRSVAGGLQHSVFLQKGTAYSWGAASSGQLGRGSPAERFHPLATAINLPVLVQMVACGGDHSVVVGVCGTVWSFGRNSDGQLGTGSDRDASRPVKMAVPAASQVACGADHSLVLSLDGDIWACGRGSEGQLGRCLDGEVRALVPLRSVSSPRAALIACGADHSIFLDLLGRAFAFGENSKGQLGLGHCETARQPAQMLLPSGFLAVDAVCGGMHTLILADDTHVYGCGGNEKGQLGLGPKKDRLVPAPVRLHAKGTACRAQRVSCGFNYSLLLKDGSVWVLGGRSAPTRNCPNEVSGRPHYATHTIPWQVRGQLDELQITDIGAGGGHALCTAVEGVFSFSTSLTDNCDRPDSAAIVQVDRIAV
eukprot:TRINITY_DN4813_c0_g1_i1.p1 TRINITY_DN4813_c0_g1~~TRINITY_DN4813_c0_g1_i1.p1  ORF type:complete len:704 (+),score=61.05 TRINITY_DN4813_c0_g1_i1:71-2182(+)